MDKWKISLKSAIIIGIIIILLISIIGIGVYSIYLTKSNDNAENVLEQKIGSNAENVQKQTKESDITENGFYRIKGKIQIYYIKMNKNQIHHIRKRLFIWMKKPKII